MLRTQRTMVRKLVSLTPALKSLKGIWMRWFW